MAELHRLSSLALLPVGIVALTGGLWFAASILAPTALGLMIGIVAAPFAVALAERGVPPRAAAVATFAASLTSVALLALFFQPTVAHLVERAPEILADLRELAWMVRGFFRGVSDVTSAVSDALVPEARADGGSDAAARIPSVTDALLMAPGLLSQLLIFVGVLFFYLLSRDEILDWIARVCEAAATSGQDTATAVRARLETAERDVSRYFVTVTLINATLGAATALVLHFIGLPGAITWGLVACLLNFLPYLGPSLFMGGLLLAGIVSFEGGMSLVPAAAFLVLNVIEGQFATPTLVARQLSLNPLAVFLALVFGIWLWGPIGGVVAIPALVWLRSVAVPARAEAPDSGHADSGKLCAEPRREGGHA